MSRQIVSYSDLSPAPSAPTFNSPQIGPQGANRPSNPTSTRGQGNHRGRGRGRGGKRTGSYEHVQSGGGEHGGMNGDDRRKKRRFQESLEHDRVHWDAQGQRSSGSIMVNYEEDNESRVETNGKQVVTQSCEKRSVVITDPDAWDDNALIDAWDAAMEEYRIMNGPESDWKKEPVHKDSLWYKTSERMQWQDVVPSDPTSGSSSNHVHTAEEPNGEFEGSTGVEDEEVDTGETDEGLKQTYQQAMASLPDISSFSKDELFQKAVDASYWAGFWAAAYHSRPGTGATKPGDPSHAVAKG